MRTGQVFTKKKKNIRERNDRNAIKKEIFGYALTAFCIFVLSPYNS